MAVPAVTTDDRMTDADLPRTIEAFHDLHERMFSYSVRKSSVDLFHWRVVAHRSVG